MSAIGSVPTSGDRATVLERLHRHHLDYLVQILLTHRDRRNRAVHVATDIGILSAFLLLLGQVRLPAAVSSMGFLPATAAPLVAIALLLYALPLEPLAAFIVALLIAPVCCLAEVVARGGGGKWTLALAIALYSISSGVAGLSHIICRDRTVVDFSLPLAKKASAYLRTALTSLPHFVLLFLLDRGYRPALYERIHAQEEVDP